MHFSLSTVLAAASLVSGAAVKRQSSPTTVYKFSGSAWLENIAVRSNGQVLVTRFDVPQLWSVDPVAKTAKQVATFSSALQSDGIAEYKPDVFAVITGNLTTSGTITPGSWALWKVDFTGATPTSTLLKTFPDSIQFNGLATFDNDTLLIGDGGKGSIVKYTVSTNTYSVLIQDATLAPPSSTGFSEGIDGLKYLNGTIYFTNIFKNTYYQLKIDPVSATAIGTPTLIANLPQSDDLSFGPDGAQYVASSGKILKVLNGKSTTIGTVSGATASAFGRTDKDKSTLYVTTNSGSLVSLPVTF